MSNKHVILLGDSIFDNAAYVPDGTAVIDHLTSIIPLDWKATLLAKDGDVTADVEEQLPQIPEDASYLVISVGGNDALMALETFSLPVARVNDALSILAEIRKGFQCGYHAMLWQALGLNLPVVVCTIYDAVPGLEIEAQTALAIFNDIITREAAAAGASVIDLRQICTQADDYSYSSPIEPSEKGGLKIAQAIAASLI